MSKKNQTPYQEAHPGYDGGAGFGGRQPRIDTPEKERGAQRPRPFESDNEKEQHPGYEGK